VNSSIFVLESTCTDTVEASAGALEHTVAAPVQRISCMTSAGVGGRAQTVSAPTITLSYTPTEHVLQIASATERLCPESSLQNKRQCYHLSEMGYEGVIWIGKGPVADL
jgi:hypothetical protein